MPYTLRVLWRTFKNYRSYIAVLVVLGFLSAILEGVGINAAIPLLTFLLNGGNSMPTDTISGILQSAAHLVGLPFNFRTLLAFIFTLFVLRAMSTVVFGYIRGWITADYFYEESKNMVGRTLQASWPFFIGQKIGTVQTTLVRDIQRTTNLLDVVGQVIQSFSGFFMYLLVALSISPVTTLFTFVGGGVLLGIIRPLLRRIQRTADAMALTEKDISQSLAEQVSGMKSIKAAAIEPAIYADTTAHMSLLRGQQVTIALVRSVSSALFQPFTLFFITVAFYISYHSPDFSLISFGATLYLIQKIFTYLESGQSGLHVLSELVPYAHAVSAFREKLAKYAELSSGTKGFIFTKEIKAEHLSLSYQGGEPVVRDVSFTIQPGRMLAIIGPSGAGKTSITDLLLRLFEPTSGSLTVDGVPARDVALPQWRSHFAYVSQDPFMFNGTIGENIRFFRDSVSTADIEEAARQANIYDFVMSLPSKFDTVVGDRGVALSGGQRQRVVLARALAARPAILVLDEATSALDVDSERLIQESIRNLHGSITIIVVAHRLSTIENADTILVMDNGRITEQGSPEDLRADPSSYFSRHTQ